MILENPLYLSILVFLIPIAYRVYSAPERHWKIVGVSYMFVVALIAVAAASPQIQVSSDSVESRKLVYLDDRSRSMAGESPEVSLDGVSVRERVLVSGNSSRIGAALESYLEPNTTYLVRSDFQGIGNLEQAVAAFNRQNSTLNVLEPELDPEHSVYVDGPSLTVSGAQNSFEINVSSTEGTPKTVSLRVDGENVKTEDTSTGFKFDETFEDKGYHRVVAEVQADDGYSENNVYYKTVRVVDKPRILVIGDRGGLGEQLSEFFDVTYSESVPDDLSEYYSVNLKENIRDTGGLKPYLVEGNGLVYTGDGSMDILPVKEVPENQDTENPAIVLALDISEGLGGSCENWLDPDSQNVCISRSSSGGSIEDSRSFAFNLINAAKSEYPGTKMGGLLYNEGYLPLSQPQPLRVNAEEMMSKISRIQLEGRAFHKIGVERSREMIEKSGNIILVTDGQFPPSGGVYGPGPRELESSDVSQNEYETKLVDYAETLPSDIKLFTVAVGEDKNTDFLDELAQAGGGIAYSSVSEFYSKPPTFMGGGGAGTSGILSVVDENHFITRDLNSLKISASSFDSVEPKPSANLLVASTNGEPALTSWRYGLGRVASFSAGQKDLDRFLSQEPQIVARSVSWASGNPQRKENRTVTVSSARKGEEVTVKSSYPIEGLTRSSRNSYTAVLNPETLGFHSFNDHEFSYNYRPELQRLGYREEFARSAAEATGGEVVSPEEIERLKPSIPVKTREVVERRSLSAIFLISALIVYLLQIGYRKRKGLI